MYYGLFRGGGVERLSGDPMSREPLRLLLVENSPEDAELILHGLHRAGFELAPERVETADELREALTPGPELDDPGGL